jgi:hypothetical protein
VAGKLFQASSSIGRKVKNAGDIADYIAWGSNRFGRVKLLPRRESLWALMILRLRSDPIRGIEFGVAHGYGTGWWLSRLRDRPVRWDGFDRFTGLPRSWRGLEGGAFDAGGEPPDIRDERVTWHVGDVQDTLADLELDRSAPAQTVVLFDLDIFEPSLDAWNHIESSLRPGDLLYFDEAFDSDERRLLNEHVLPAGEFVCLGSTPTALALEIVHLDEPD